MLNEIKPNQSVNYRSDLHNTHHASSSTCASCSSLWPHHNNRIMPTWYFSVTLCLVRPPAKGGAFALYKIVIIEFFDDR